MTAYVTTAAGRTFQLPVPLSWELNYTAGVPSDSFWVRCPWQASQGTDSTHIHASVEKENLFACQFHPEFTSTPRDGHPLFAGFVKAASDYQKRQAK